MRLRGGVLEGVSCRCLAGATKVGAPKRSELVPTKGALHFAVESPSERERDGRAEKLPKLPRESAGDSPESSASRVFRPPKRRCGGLHKGRRISKKRRPRPSS